LSRALSGNQSVTSYSETGNCPGQVAQLACTGYWLLACIRYDTRCYFNVRSKADMSQLNLPHGNDNKKLLNRKTKK